MAMTTRNGGLQGADFALHLGFGLKPPFIMSRQSISLKTRVRYEGRAQIIDRRATKGADLEKLPNPIWYMITKVLRGKLGKAGKKK
jgi:hypothetical protein